MFLYTTVYLVMYSFTASIFPMLETLNCFCGLFPHHAPGILPIDLSLYCSRAQGQLQLWHDQCFCAVFQTCLVGLGGIYSYQPLQLSVDGASHGGVLPLMMVPKAPSFPISIV
ncbi:hypothetical protein AMECASPLE_034289 [Ameca splendens]|uniref:Uncharacterized protein n=1 Tax=Ameca splendens TaxID=208324 RepID=A0ABV0XVW7_9TELE